MRFSVFALSSVPDTATTRALFDLDDLDDKSVSKVLFHRRKQQTGSSEILRWDQRALAALTLIHHAEDGVRVESMHFAAHSEEAMLHGFYQAALGEGRMVSWGDGHAGIPLLHFRTLKHAISYPAYWQALKTGADLHLDIRSRLSPPSDDLPALDETARKLGFPGLLDRTEEDVMDAWLQGRSDDVLAFSDITALNTYLLALRLFAVTGEMTGQDSARAEQQLLDALGGREDRHLAEFVSAWGKK
jgi:predicted PolB exonuclease-like 3'-5' exonuclease